MVRWREVVEEAKKEAYKYYSAHGIPLTLRGLFYILVSKNVIPNTRNAYNELSRHVAEARYRGSFPWHLIHDKTRSISWGDVGYSVVDAQRVVEELGRLTEEEKQRILEEYLKSRYSIRLRQWEGQPKRVMVVVEKDAVFDLFRDVVKVQLGWDVGVTFSRGFESASHAKEVARWIRSLRDAGVSPVLLFVYDFDPSGEYASIRDFVFRVLLLASDEDVDEYLRRWDEGGEGEKAKVIDELSSKLGVTFEKVMLTWEQVVKYDIPPRPESAEALAKLQRDPRRKWFVERYGELYQAEVDALLALNPDEVKRIIDEAIRKHFDFKVYEEVKKREEELRRRVEEALS